MKACFHFVRAKTQKARKSLSVNAHTRINMKITKAMFVSAAGSMVLGTLLIGSVAFAQTAPANPPTGAQGGWGAGGGRAGGMMGRMPGVFGTVSAISGTTLTITSKMPQRPAAGTTPAAGSAPVMTTTTYTVDASAATVTKAAAASSVSAIAIGDTVMVQGTVSGTSVTAKTIRDGVVPMGKGMGPRPQGGQAPAIQGNGQPVVGGSVTAVSGNTITVTTAQGGIAYNVDASSATVTKANATSSVASIATGDKVVVQGTVNGTSVTASSVMDQGAAQGNTASGGTCASRGGLMGMVQGFFQHLFGFF